MEAALITEGNAESSTGSKGPLDVQRSMSNCVVSAGRECSIARPYLARLLSAFRGGHFSVSPRKRNGALTASGPNFLRYAKASAK